MNSELVKAINEALHAAPKMQSEPPWRLVTHTSAGGALAAGFDQTTEDLIVVSENGQAIFDGTNGNRSYRNRENSAYDQTRLEAERLDQKGHNPIRMAGEHGGGLPLTTSDEWSIDIFQIHWPTAFSVLHHPGASIYFLAPKWKDYAKDASFRVLMKSEGLPVAFGFSWSGNSLVWLDRRDLFIWHRDT